MRVLFFGSPDFAVSVLKKLCESKHEIIGAVCQADKPSGRGQKLAFPPVKEFCLEKNIPIFQFAKLKEHVSDIANLKPDIMVTAAYGQIINKDILSICTIINVHGSLLPDLRGAAPIQWAIMNGYTKTGVTIMKTEVGIDDGDIIKKVDVDICEDDTYQTLSSKMAEAGGNALLEVLEMFEKGSVEFHKQPDTFTYARMLKKEDGFLDFNLLSEELVNKVRALGENPGAYFYLGEEKILVYKAKICEGAGAPGQILEKNKKLVIATKNAAIEILTLQRQGGKILSARDFLNGKKILEEKVN